MGTIMHVSDSDPGVGILALTGVGFNNRIVLCSRKCMSTHKHTEKLVKWVQNTAGWSGSNEGGAGGGAVCAMENHPKAESTTIPFDVHGEDGTYCTVPTAMAAKKLHCKRFPVSA